jgi:hypothetical protein
MLVDALLLANDYLKLTSYIEGPSRFWKVCNWASSSALKEWYFVRLFLQCNKNILVSICDAHTCSMSIATRSYSHMVTGTCLH